MAGKPYKVGRFAHTLRVRLMREHVGVDVDAMSEEDIMDNDPIKPEHDQGVWDPDSEQKMGQEDIVRVKSKRTPVNVLFQDVVHSVGQSMCALTFRKGCSNCVLQPCTGMLVKVRKGGSSQTRICLLWKKIRTTVTLKLGVAQSVISCVIQMDTGTWEIILCLFRISIQSQAIIPVTAAYPTEVSSAR
jgi:hypothetical protein